MIKRILNILFRSSKLKKSTPPLAEFMKEHEMTFHGYGGLNIGGLLVKEFNYLFRYYSKSNGSLIDFPSILEINFSDIKGNIYQELTSGNMKEMESLNICEKTARNNLNNLLNILEVLEKYKDECDRLGVPYADGEKF